jgi:polysaccharide biosynthesis protein VpsJ
MYSDLSSSIRSLARWLESHAYEAYDPGDGNTSYLHALTFNVILLERFLQQAVYRAPCNLRPLLGIHPHRSTKGAGYIAWAYLKMFRLSNDRADAEKAVSLLQWLMDNKSPGFSEYCWGNHFRFSSRGGRIPKLSPTIVWSSLIGQAFLEAHEVLGDEKYLKVAASVCRWITALPREQTKAGCCLSYVTFAQSSIHNSSMLGAALLARVGQKTNDDAMVALAGQAMLYSCSRLRPDHAWYYGEDAKHHWIDNFHTGYNLDSLKRYREASGDHQFDECSRNALAYFKATFIEPNGRPKYYHNQTFPIDIQCAAQCIDTLAFFSDEDDECLALSRKVAQWTIQHMQDPDGHFYYRDLGWALNKTPMLHWGQGTMFKALAHLLAKSGKAESPQSARPAHVRG